MNEIDITPEPIDQYCVQHSTPLATIFSELSKATEKEFPQVAHMQVGSIEGNLLSILVKLLRAERVVEFGTFTGFSSLCIASALPEGGVVTTLDRDPKATQIAKEFWNKAGLASRVEFMLGDAKTSIVKIEDEIKTSSRKPYDLAFIDADKAGYDAYYEASLRLVKKGGAIIIDNVLWSGAVLNPIESNDKIIAAFNEKLKNDLRVHTVMLPVRDGISILVIN